MKGFSIGHVSKLTGVGIEALRFYEREGVIDPPVRASSGYRMYDRRAVRKLRFVKRAQALGFTLKEIQGLLALSEGPETETAQVRQVALDKVADIESRITDLKRIKAALKALAERCPGHGPLEECPILLALQPPGEVIEE